MKIRIFITCLLIFAGMFSFVYGGGMGVNKEQAIKVASKYLLDKKYALNDKKIFVDDTNSRWMLFVSNKQIVNANIKVLEKLKDKNYWAINYVTSKRNIKGGEAWIFIDKQSSEVILYFLLK